ncbi:hypothetical protein N7463_001575 [Penicillium fimorum]|uniref:Uncharacterized protein n=1 Tax=Penicillium fimorum TaxID=1882269 RepID=A0A9W9Y995_9EURO|nr:hypothetical protein N7463_001575 [Penicillium fimorum]
MQTRNKTSIDSVELMESKDMPQSSTRSSPVELPQSTMEETVAVSSASAAYDAELAIKYRKVPGPESLTRKLEQLRAFWSANPVSRYAMVNESFSEMDLAALRSAFTCQSPPRQMDGYGSDPDRRRPALNSGCAFLRGGATQFP